jgi:hypothetical protein
VHACTTTMMILFANHVIHHGYIHIHSQLPIYVCMSVCRYVYVRVIVQDKMRALNRFTRYEKPCTHSATRYSVFKHAAHKLHNIQTGVQQQHSNRRAASSPDKDIHFPCLSNIILTYAILQRYLSLGVSHMGACV